MNNLRTQRRYEFCPPQYARWFRPVLHLLAGWFLRYRFNIREITIRGQEEMVRLVKEGQSVMVTPNHADHADPSLLVQVGRRFGLAFHFMAAREGFEKSRVDRFVLQKSGAFSVDREGGDVASIKTAMAILRECRFPLVIFPEGEIYHHHEALDVLNDGVATILLRAAEKLPEGKRSYAVPAAIRISHDPGVAETFSRRLDRLEQRITWKPQSGKEAVERIYRLGAALLSIKEEEFMGKPQGGFLVDRIRGLQMFLVEEAERKHGLWPGEGVVPSRIKGLRQVIRRELTSGTSPLSREREGELYDDLDRIFIAQQLYSYPGQYLQENPTIDRIAETIHKLEEDVMQEELYPVPRRAQIVFGEAVDVRRFLGERGLNAKTGVRPMTEVLREKIEVLMGR